MTSIRPLAIGVFRNGSRILVARGHGDSHGGPFMRPIGGQIEFGETAEAALRREIREELDAEIDGIERLGVLENRFTYRGRPGHEIVFVFDARFVDASLYDAAGIPILEPVWDGPAIWLDLARPLPVPLYPDGLVDLLGVTARGT